MAYDLWGESPLYENEDPQVGRIPTVTPIDQVPDEGNCGQVTSRGEEACECAVKLTHQRRRQPHSRQSCKVTNRNSIQGRRRQVSEPNITKPSSFIRIGKLRACAAKAIRLILGDPPHVSAREACLNAEPSSVNGGGVGRKSAEVIVLPSSPSSDDRKDRTMKNREERPTNLDGGATQRTFAQVLKLVVNEDKSSVRLSRAVFDGLLGANAPLRYPSGSSNRSGECHPGTASTSGLHLQASV